MSPRESHGQSETRGTADKHMDILRVEDRLRSSDAHGLGRFDQNGSGLPPAHGSQKMPRPTEPNTSWSIGERGTPGQHGNDMPEKSSWRVEEPPRRDLASGISRTGDGSGREYAGFPTGEVTQLLGKLQDNVMQFQAVRDRHDDYQHTHSTVSHDEPHLSPIDV